MPQGVVATIVQNGVMSNCLIKGYEGCSERGKDKMIKGFLVDVREFEDKALYEGGVSLLTPRRKKKIEDLHGEEGKRLSLGAGLLLRHAFITVAKEDLSEKIVIGPYGQPVLPDDGLHFSLSHSKNFALCCIADGPIGCDLEAQRKKLPQVLKRVFTQKEHAEFSAFTPEEQRQLFFQIWTRKESFVKWLGRGIGFPFSEFAVFTNGDFVEDVTYNKKTVCFRGYSLEDYEIALCCENKDFPDEIQQIQAKLLTEY